MSNRIRHTQVTTGKVFIHQDKVFCAICHSLDGISYPGLTYIKTENVTNARHRKSWWRFW